jgi:hypothetical protein
MVSDMPGHDIDAYTDALMKISDIVDDAIAKAYQSKEGFARKLKLGNLESKIIYSAWDCEGEAVPQNNLDEIPHRGTFVVIADYDSFWDSAGSGEMYISEPVTDPTWLELAILANEAMHVTGDFHHCFFESVDVIDDGKALKLWYGS